MKRRIRFVLAALLFACILSGCQLLCSHDWEPATCTEPEVCSKCEKTEGEALGHDWEKATCEEPKTCSRCAKTRGDSKGHRWEAATCTQPQICLVCGKTEGEPLEHNWQEATCEAPKTCPACGVTEGKPLEHLWQAATTEAPKICIHCQLTDGLPIQTDSRFSTAETAAIQGPWMTTLTVSGDLLGEPEFTGILKGSVYLNFGDTGILSIRLETDNMEEFETALFQYAKQKVYAEFAARGIGESAADLVIRATFGMTTDSYVTQILEEIDVPGMIDELTKDRVYYAQNDTVYIADNWSSSFTASTYRFAGKKLIFDAVYLTDPNAPLQWSPITE